MKNQETLMLQRIASYAKAAIVKGQCFTLRMERQAKLKKAFKGADLKVRSTYSCQRAEYGNKEVVRRAVQNGLRHAPKLPEWAQRFEVEGVTFWRHKQNKTEYFPFPLFGDKKQQWLLNGQEVNREDVRHMVLASELAERPTKEDLADKGQAPFRTPKVKNILSII